MDKFIKVNGLLPYGTSNGDSLLAKADELCSYTSLNNFYTFYDTPYNYIHVCLNGYISVDYYSTYSISSFSNLASPLVGGLSMDMDTRLSGNIFYRETNDSLILASIKSYILAYESSINASSLLLNSAFIVTYENVPFWSYPSTINSFQIIITTTSKCETFAVVIYKHLSSGQTSYYAGFSAETGILYKKLANSDLIYLANNPSLTMPSYIVYKLSYHNSNSMTCSTTSNYMFLRKFYL